MSEKKLNTRQKLIIWLYDNKTTRAEFGAKVGVTGHQVRNWLLLNLPQIPSDKSAARIEQVTNGYIKASEWN